MKRLSRRSFVVPFSLGNSFYGPTMVPSTVAMFTGKKDCKTLFLVPTLPYLKTCQAIGRIKTHDRSKNLTNHIARAIPIEAWNMRVLNWDRPEQTDTPYFKAVFRSSCRLLQEDKEFGSTFQTFIASKLQQIGKSDDAIHAEQLEIGIDAMLLKSTFALTCSALCNLDGPVSIVYKSRHTIIEDFARVFCKRFPDDAPKQPLSFVTFDDIANGLKE